MVGFTIYLGEKEFYSLEEFASNIYLYPFESLALIKNHKFLNYLKTYDGEKFNQINALLSKPHQDDCLLFKCQYILNPIMSLRHHKYRFETFKDLGEKIIDYSEDVDVYLKDFLKYHLLTYYMEISKYDTKEPALYHKIKELEELYPQNENRAYFLLGFILRGKNEFKYHGRVFLSPHEVLKFALNNQNINDFARNFTTSQYFEAYLVYCHHEKEITLLENMISTLEEKEQKYGNIRKV